jgi:hypothetical protein
MTRLSVQMFMWEKITMRFYMKNNMYQMMELITIYNVENILLQHILLI